jgi:hypothetical protein
LLRKVFVHNYLRCPRGYAISMNPADGSPNRIVRLLGRFRWARTSLATTLRLYSLAEGEMRAAEPVLRAHRGPVRYLSLAGVKDIVLQSSGAPLPLLHAQFGALAAPAAACAPAPRPGHVHMFCAPEGDPLHEELARAGLHPSASASVIHHRMDRADWKFILTSDI